MFADYHIVIVIFLINLAQYLKPKQNQTTIITTHFNLLGGFWWDLIYLQIILLQSVAKYISRQRFRWFDSKGLLSTWILSCNCHVLEYCSKMLNVNRRYCQGGFWYDNWSFPSENNMVQTFPMFQRFDNVTSSTAYSHLHRFVSGQWWHSFRWDCSSYFTCKLFHYSLFQNIDQDKSLIAQCFMALYICTV